MKNLNAAMSVAFVALLYLGACEILEYATKNVIVSALIAFIGIAWWLIRSRKKGSVG